MVLNHGNATSIHVFAAMDYYLLYNNSLRT